MGRVPYLPTMEFRDHIGHHLPGLGAAPVVITRRGGGVAVVVSIDRWNNLQDDIDELKRTIRRLEERMVTHGITPYPPRRLPDGF